MILEMFATTKGMLSLVTSFATGVLAEAIGEGSPVTVGLMILLLIGCWHLSGTLRGFKDDIVDLKQDVKTSNLRLGRIEGHISLTPWNQITEKEKKQN